MAFGCAGSSPAFRTNYQKASRGKPFFWGLAVMEDLLLRCTSCDELILPPQAEHQVPGLQMAHPGKPF